MQVKVRINKKTGEAYLKLSDFKSIIDTRKVKSYELQLRLNGQFAVTFYDKKNNVVKPDVDGVVVFYGPKSNTIGLLEYNNLQTHQTATMNGNTIPLRGNKKETLKYLQNVMKFVVLGEL